MEEVFKRTALLEINEYPRDYRDCLRQAVKECVSDEELRDTYNLLDITYDQYIEDLCRSYLGFKRDLISAYWK